MLTNVEISGSALLRHAPEQIPDVFEGAPLVAALALRADGGKLLVRGQLAHETWEHELVVPAKQPGEGNQAIAALYGRERVADVEARGLFDSVDGEIEDLGLTFQIATRKTSWVAIDETRIVSGPTKEQLIPQELPYGTQASAFGLRGVAPATAAPMAMRFDATDRLEMLGEASISADEFADFGEEAPSEVFAEAPRSMVTKAGTLKKIGAEMPGGAPPPPRAAMYSPMPPPLSSPAPEQQKARGDEGGAEESRTTGKYAAVGGDAKLDRGEEEPVAARPARPQQMAAAPISVPKPAPENTEALAAMTDKPPKKVGPITAWVYLVFALIIAALIWWFLR
jgi:Ca-activated chloride channel family protein